MNQTYHVAKTGNDRNVGSEIEPFLTISKAASVASERDAVIVHEGTYREWVKPENGAYDESSRIVYQAAEGEKVIIKGSEVVNDWEKVEGSIWKVILPNYMFGDYNPYVKRVEGDWCFYPEDWRVHAGDVYLNGKSLYEARTYGELKEAKMREYFVFPWAERKEYYAHPEDTVYQWYPEVDDEYTTIYANFHEVNPNETLTEINVRMCCFYPDRVGIDYITVRGFEIAQAACHWAPPTGDQVGMVGPHWSKGWIIEDNILHDAKCSAISIGKEKSTGDQISSKRRNKPGYHSQMECVFDALRRGWSKENIGSHIIRNNVIYDCGQNAVVGHLGCIFSEIYGNHIYNIGVKHEFFGWEVAGVKLHAPIDTQFYGNCIHDCTLGFWMDWEAQGTRISRNVFYDNQRDGFIEVTHGPMIIDNNIFASEYAFDNHAQGTAFVNNIFNGYQVRRKILDRATPYHLPHSTQVKGYAFVHLGDDRYYNNIFVKRTLVGEESSYYGTEAHNGHTQSMEEFISSIHAGGGDHEDYFVIEQPMYQSHNVYYNGAKAFDKEVVKYETDADSDIKIIVEGDEVFLEMNVDKGALLETKVYDTESLGKVRIADARYDAPTGEFLAIDRDYNGKMRELITTIGPFADLKEGINRWKIWPNQS
ncbi:MAG: right-handed parallel beta-helix repeat-containing protein [Lachnospiraceae bacterium]